MFEFLRKYLLIMLLLIDWFLLLKMFMMLIRFFNYVFIVCKICFCCFIYLFFFLLVGNYRVERIYWRDDWNYEKIIGDIIDNGWNYEEFIGICFLYII